MNDESAILNFHQDSAQCLAQNIEPVQAAGLDRLNDSTNE
jgi:hypothetical protein